MSEPASAKPTSEPCAIDARMLQVMMAAAAYQARRVERTLRLSPAEREDVEQEILLVLMERRRFFDPARGPWTPFAHRIARQAAQQACDAIVAAGALYGGSLDQPMGQIKAGDDEPATVADCAMDGGAPSEADILDMLSLMLFVRRLPAELRVVAEAALRADGDLADAQRTLGLSTTEFYRRLREIRYRMFTVRLVDRRDLIDR